MGREYFQMFSMSCQKFQRGDPNQPIETAARMVCDCLSPGVSCWVSDPYGDYPDPDPYRDQPGPDPYREYPDSISEKQPDPDLSLKQKPKVYLIRLNEFGSATRFLAMLSKIKSAGSGSYADPPNGF